MSIRVLIADPDEDLLRTYHICLRGKGFEVATVTDGPRCVALLKDFAPDVLLLEPDLPDEWGPRLLDEMRSASDVPCVPVIVLTRLDPLAATYPVCEYHVKPFSLAELADRIALAARGDIST